MQTTFDSLPEMIWTQTWQISVLVILTIVVTLLFAKRRPHLAFVFWTVVFIKCLTPPLLCSPIGLFAWDISPAIERIQFDSDTEQTAPLIPADSSIAKLPVSLSAEDESIFAGQTNRKQLDTAITLAMIADADVSGTPAPATAASALGTWHLIPRLLVAFWLGGVLLIVTYAARQWVLCFCEIRKHSRPAGRQITGLLNQLNERLGLQREVRVVVTANHGPMVFGFLRPTIILPDVLVKSHSPKELIPVLTHELIHVRRGDTLLSLLQFIAQTCWWFNPLVWWANRETNRICERCCDVEVIAALKCKPAEYARSLISIVALGRTFRPVPAASGIRTADVTGRRLKSIMNRNNLVVSSTPRWCWLLAIATLLLVLPATGIAIPQDKEARVADDSSSSPAATAWGSQDWATAAEQYALVAEDNPRDGVAWFRLGYALHAEGRLDEAIVAHEKAAEFPQGKPIALYNWACALALQGETEAALAKLEESLDAGFRSPTPIESDTDFTSLLENETFKSLAARVAKPDAYGQFDFWVGDWQVEDKDGNVIGSNQISKHEDGHLIRESWTGGDGSTGQSINYFDPTERAWKQTYVGSKGTIYQFTGTASDNGMSMEGATTLRTGLRAKCRMDLTTLDDGRVKQVIELSKDNGDTWEPSFEGFYVRQDDKAAEK